MFLQLYLFLFMLQLHPSGHVLVIGYKDLLLEAIKYNKQEIACKLAFHGVDCSVREKVSTTSLNFHSYPFPC